MNNGVNLSESKVSEAIDVLWITAVLGCDGDTIAITAATQPSLEELVLGAIPGIPKVRIHNPFLSYENGEEFMELFHRAAAAGDRGDAHWFWGYENRRYAGWRSIAAHLLIDC